MPAPVNAPPFLLVATGASRLADPARRTAIVDAAGVALLGRTGVVPEVRLTETAAEGRAAAQDAVAAGAPILVVVGGDGSVRSAASVLAGTPVALGIVPGGTGNLMAAALGIPRSPERAVAALATARARAIDVGRAWVGAAETPTPFIVAAGVGFDARVMAATTDRRKRSLGIGAYFATAAAVATRLRPFPVRLVVDGVAHETDALAVLVANAGELIPGLLRPRLPLIPDDGQLDVFVARGRGAVGGSRAALGLLLGRGVHAEIGPYATRFAARRVEVVAPAGEPVEVDGDIVGGGRFVAEVIPGAVRILVPAGGVGRARTPTPGQPGPAGTARYHRPMTTTPPASLPFTGDPEADGLLAADPLALLIGFALDQQVTVQKAFAGPLELRRRIGTLDAAAIAAVDPEALQAAFRERPALHRFPGSMATRVQDLCAIVARDYGGDASRVWREARDGADLDARLRALPGIGEMKAKTLVGLLAKRFGVRPPGWEAVAPTHPTLADVDSAEGLARYQEQKRAWKASQKAAADQ